MNTSIAPVRNTPRIVLLAVLGALGLLVMALPSLASARDRNHDRIPDRWEKNHSLSLKVKQTKRDQDRDALNNGREFLASMDPHDADSDDDGTDDGDEGSGTITAYDDSTGELTIALFGGQRVSGLVTDDTEVSCDHGDDNGDEDGDDEGGDDDHSGPGHDGTDDDDDQGDDDDRAVRSSVSSDDDEGDDDQGDDDQGDDDQGEDEDADDEDTSCTSSDLAVGAVVQEADLEIEDGVATWEEIELLG